MSLLLKIEPRGLLFFFGRAAKAAPKISHSGAEASNLDRNSSYELGVFEGKVTSRPRSQAPGHDETE